MLASLVRIGIFTCVALSAHPFACAQSHTQPPSDTVQGKPVDFQRDIRPLLSDRCYQCHGPDEATREAGLRLDQEHFAFEELEAGGFAIVAGEPSESLLFERITAEDEGMRMPPADINKPLTPEEIALIRRWIQQGAEFDEHWSFVAPERPEPPAIKAEHPFENDIDRFVAAKLGEIGLRHSPVANKETLIRRVTLDLTGLPPSIEEVDAFLADDSADAYERLVDRLLDSPRYGEHMARYWLDAARYGDTHGLHLDNRRQIWPYRDWAIQAFNDNMPYDQFVIEQLAGDLLPEPTLDQLVATGFNRCNVTTSEGGSINEEYRVRYAVDRVETTFTVFQGLTTGCAVCHEHKFDPISQKEFYQLYAYFYNFAEKEMDGNALLPPPVVRVPGEDYQEKKSNIEEQLSETSAAIREALRNMEYSEPELADPDPAEPFEYVWIEDEVPTGANAQGNTPWEFVTAPEHPVQSGTRSTFRTTTGLGQHFFTDASQPLQIGEGDRLFAYVYLDPENPPQEIMLQFNSGGSWDHRAYWGENRIDWGTNDTPARYFAGALPEQGDWVRLEVAATDVGLAPGSTVNGWAFTQFSGSVYWDRAGMVTQTRQDGMQFRSFASWRKLARAGGGNGLPDAVKQALLSEAEFDSGEEHDGAAERVLLDYFLEYIYADARETFEPLHARRKGLQENLAKLDNSQPQTLVMADRPAEQWATAYVLKRGQYDMPDTEQAVEPNVPSSLPPLPADAQANRLGLARWIVSESNPLTARVTVNRYWQQLFGTGIVRTSEDFGAQGEYPTHPELLDWLAVEFVESGWDLKALLKRMVMSHTYRQGSAVLPEHLAIDAGNRYLGRSPRFRLDAEVIRDLALSSASLLNEQVGGPSVRPYQPSGLWRAVGYTSSNTANFEQDHGAALYRRSMYTFWKRTSPPPSMQILDAPSREVCTLRRERTNTPAAALVTLNDVQFVEASRVFAEHALSGEAQSDEERIITMFRTVVSREPNEKEHGLFLKLLSNLRALYEQDTAAAEQLASVGESPTNDSLDKTEVAAWTMIANTILNLDEALTKN